jgi:hypothetical protein
MIEITPSLSLDDSEIQLDFIRASDPGGQMDGSLHRGADLEFISKFCIHSGRQNLPTAALVV